MPLAKGLRYLKFGRNATSQAHATTHSNISADNGAGAGPHLSAPADGVRLGMQGRICLSNTLAGHPGDDPRCELCGRPRWASTGGEFRHSRNRASCGPALAPSSARLKNSKQLRLKHKLGRRAFLRDLYGVAARAASQRCSHADQVCITAASTPNPTH